MPPDRATPTLETLLRDGASAAEVYAALEAIEPSRRDDAIAALTPEARRHLPGKRPEAHPDDTHDALLKLMFDHTPDDEPETLARLVGARFHLHIGPDRDPDDGKPARWDGHGLRHLWTVLEGLPPADVEDNERLRKLVRYQVDEGHQASGAYGRLTAAIGYDAGTLDMAEKAYSQAPPARHRRGGDPLYGVNAFNETVRHEVGHAVDARLGVMERNGQGPAFGGWTVYGKDVAAVARAMIEAAGGPIHSWKDPAQREQIVAWLARRLECGQVEKIDEALAELPFLDDAIRQQLKEDPALLAASQCTSDKEPWMRRDLEGGIPVGGRIFQEGYKGHWYSYEHAARQRKVSLYQFRAPGEWFAEVYAAYYEPDIGAKERGARLKERDPQTWTWFKENLDGK